MSRSVMFSFVRRLIRALRHSNDYVPLSYRALNSPEENTRGLLELTTRDFQLIKNRGDEQCLFVGRFFGLSLLVEKKLVQLLEDFDLSIEEKTFGRKIECYKNFLNEVEDTCPYEVDIVSYRNLVGPLKELKSIRDSMAHSLAKTSFAMGEIKQLSELIRKLRPDLFEAAHMAPREDERCLVMVANFGFHFSVEVARLNQLIA